MKNSPPPARLARPARLADVLALLRALPAADEACAEAVRRRDSQLTKPAGALGRLEELAVWLASWQRRAPPALESPVALVFAANHGVAERGVSAYPVEVTRQMVANFAAGGAAINQIARCNGIALKIVPLNLDAPTADISRAAAMSEEACLGAFVAGMEAVPKGADLLCLGEMGIGNTTAASALCAALLSADSSAAAAARAWVGPGTGVVGAALRRKRAVVAAALELHRAGIAAAREAAPLQALCALGGRELAAIAGAVLEARLRCVPVLLDGFAGTASAAVLAAVRADALAHCFVAHRSAEPAHGRLLRHLEMLPLLDLGMRLGEASGAALAVGLLRCAVECHAGMATFAEAAVAGKLGE